MEIKRSGSQPSRKGPAEYFTGDVRVDPLFEVPDPGRVLGGEPKEEIRPGDVIWRPPGKKHWHGATPNGR
jgi:hypothetical protein